MATTPSANTASGVDAGAVNILHGSHRGLAAYRPPLRNNFWSQNSPGILDTAEARDGLGGSLASGDLDGDGFDDLMIGAPWEDIGSTRDACMTNTLFGSEKGLHQTGNQVWSQDTPGILDSAEPQVFRETQSEATARNEPGMR